MQENLSNDESSHSYSIIFLKSYNECSSLKSTNKYNMGNLNTITKIK